MKRWKKPGFWRGPYDACAAAGGCRPDGCAVQSAAQAMPDITVVAGVDRAPFKGSALPVFHELSACGIPADVLVEFSSPQAVAAALPICTERGLPCVLCTTGLSPAQQAAVEKASAQIPVFQSANMSLGVAVLAVQPALRQNCCPPGVTLRLLKNTTVASGTPPAAPRCNWPMPWAGLFPPAALLFGRGPAAVPAGGKLAFML